MRKANVVLLGMVGVFSLAACSKEKQPVESAAGTTTIRGAEQQQPIASVDEVRTVLIERRPDAAETINGLIITNEGGIITLRGKVEDEATRSDLINRVRAMPNVRGVRDDLRMGRKAAAPRPEQGEKKGTTTTTGAPLGEGHGHEHEHGKEATPKTEAVRKAMEKARPKSESLIHGLTITEEHDGVVVKG
ncbi:MAG: hypothetical protein K0S65_1444, partial [Labilithrix sp.]|nr:hypothetical protein [Labilithrix sp.]